MSAIPQDTAPAAHMDVEESLHELLLLFPQIGKGIKRGVDGCLKDNWALSPRHAMALMYLILHEPITVSDLGARLGVSTASISLMIADLAKQGYVARHEDPDDHRKTVVTVTPEHRVQVEELMARRTAALRRTLEGLTLGERASFVKAIRGLARELHAEPTEGAPPDR